VFLNACQHLRQESLVYMDECSCAVRGFQALYHGSRAGDQVNIMPFLTLRLPSLYFKDSEKHGMEGLTCEGGFSSSASVLSFS